MRLSPLALGIAIVLGSQAAQAALTSSEQGQIRDFVAAAKVENAHKVRSLVARTDLQPEESVAALSAAITPVAFTEQRGVFLKELVFGGASAASRPVLVLATVKSLLARADAIYQKYPGGLDHERAAVQELVLVYGHLDSVIANAGKPSSTRHDAAAGVPSQTYDESSKVLREHIDRNARWLKGDGPVPDAVARVRAQAQIALVDMLPDGTTRRIDAADQLGIKGARKAILVEHGILVADAGKLDDAKVEIVRKTLARMPAARLDLGLIYAGQDSGPALAARGGVAHVAPGTERYPFVDEVAPGAYDPATSAVIHDLAIFAAKRALDARPELRAQAVTDAGAASGDPNRLLGRPRAPSVDHVIGGAIHALMIDAPRAVDVSVARLLGGRPETAALLSDALGALAQGGQQASKIEVGKAGGATAIDGLKIAPNGVVVAFKLEGHTWTIDRASPTYQVLGSRRDGAAPNVNQLGAVKGIPRDGASWSESGVTFKRLAGTPRVALLPGAEKTAPNVKLLGGGTEAFDVVTVAPPAADFTFEGELVVRDAPGGLAFRVVPSKKGFRGAALVVSPGGQTTLSVIEDTGETNLTAPLSPSPVGPVKVKIVLAGKAVEATVGGSTLKGTLPDSMATGDVALVAKRNANVEVSGFSLKRK